MTIHHQTPQLKKLLKLMRSLWGYGDDADRIARVHRHDGRWEARRVIVAMLKIEDQLANLHAVRVASAMSRFLDEDDREWRDRHPEGSR